MKKYEENMKEYDGTCGKYEGISGNTYVGNMKKLCGNMKLYVALGIRRVKHRKKCDASRRIYLYP